MKVRIARTPELRIIARNARNAGYNRQLPDEFIDTLDPDGIHVVEPLFSHEHANGKLVDLHYRCQVYLKEPGVVEPKLAIVDLMDDDLDSLREPSI